MKLKVNGEIHTHEGDGSLTALLEEWGAKPESTAVMLNGMVVRRVNWPEVTLREQDEVEVLMFAGGG